MGRWQEFILDVNKPPFVGSVLVAYQTLIPLSGKGRPKAFPAWERLVIWKPRNSENALCAQFAHVNTDICLRKLVRANLHGDGSLGHRVSLYLMDYAPGREVFQWFEGEELPQQELIVGLPPTLEEPDKIHVSHPLVEEMP